MPNDSRQLPAPDPVAAIATAPGRGAVGIVRVSGTGLAPLARALTGRDLAPRMATYGPFLEADGSPIDRGLALFFPWGVAEAQAPLALLLAMPALILKLAIGGALLALLETLSAKMRIFRVPEFLATAFLLAVIGMLVHILVRP